MNDVRVRGERWGGSLFNHHLTISGFLVPAGVGVLIRWRRMTGPFPLLSLAVLTAAFRRTATATSIVAAFPRGEACDALLRRFISPVAVTSSGVGSSHGCIKEVGSLGPTRPVAGLDFGPRFAANRLMMGCGGILILNMGRVVTSSDMQPS